MTRSSLAEWRTFQECGSLILATQEEHPDLVATASAISQAFKLFESISRKVCRQVGWVGMHL